MNNLSDFVVCDGVLTKYLGHNAEVTIPGSLTEIGERAFADCMDIRSVVIPEGVVRINREAFSNCRKLERVALPESLLEIKREAFSCCFNLYDIEIPENVQTINADAFRFVPNIIIKKGKFSNMFWGTCEPEDVYDLKTTEFGFSFKYIRDGAEVSVSTQPFFDQFHDWKPKTINGYVDGNLIYKDQSKQDVTAFINNGKPIVVPSGVGTKYVSLSNIGAPAEIFLPAEFNGVPWRVMDRNNITLLNFDSWEGLGQCYINPGDDAHPFMERVTVFGTHLKDIESVTVTPSMAPFEAIPKIIKHYPNIKVNFAEECFDDGVKISPFYSSFVKPTTSQIASIILYQSGKKWESLIVDSITVQNIDEVFSNVAERMAGSKKLTQKQVKTVFGWINDNFDLLSKEVIQKIIDVLKSRKMKTADFESLLNK